MGAFAPMIGHTSSRARRGAVLGVCALLLLALTVPAPAVAQTDDEDEGGLGDALLGAAISAAEDPRAAAASVSAWASGFAANIQGSIGGPDTTATEAAAEIQTELNAHNATYEQYLNDRITASTARDVVQIDVTVEQDDEVTTETIYLVANVSDGNYTATQVVDATNRTVDERIVLSGIAAQDAASDLETFREEYAEPNETPPPQYKARIRGKYLGHVQGTFGFLPDIEEDE